MPDERGFPDKSDLPDKNSRVALIVRVARLRAARRGLVARQVELTAAAGDVVAVEGVSGAGKSTLLAAAAGRPTRPASTPQRAGSLRRIASGAAHRTRLLTVSEWFAAPALLYLAVLGMIYAGSAGPLLRI